VSPGFICGRPEKAAFEIWGKNNIGPLHVKSISSKHRRGGSDLPSAGDPLIFEKASQQAISIQ